MPTVIDPNTGNIINITDDQYAAGRDAGVNYEAPPVAADPDAAAKKAQNEDWLKAATDPSSPTYQGPGYVIATDGNGDRVLRLSDSTSQQMWVARGGVPGKNNPNAIGVPENPNGASDDTAAAITGDTPNRDLNPYPAAPPVPQKDPFGTGFPQAIAGMGSRSPTMTPPTVSPITGFENVTPPAGFTPPPAPGDQAPDVDRSHIDPVLQKLNDLQNQLVSLAADKPSTSVAEAQLVKSQRDAAMRNALATQQSQSAALGQARSARGRGDRALLERGAVGEAAYIGQEGARIDAQNQTATEGQLGILRAQEEDANRRFKADVLGKAADLGLNSAALEVDISKTDLGSANNWINNEFQQLGINKQLDQSQTEALLSFTKDMALIQFDYDKMSTDDQEHTEDLIMQKYGVDQQTMIALKQIKQAGKFRWDQLLTSFVGGAASGGGAAVVTKLVSDVTLKTGIKEVDPNDAALLELLDGGHAYSFEYRDPKKHSSNGERGPMLGIMAQDLEKTKLGKSMVSRGSDGKKAVDVPKLASAAFGATKLLLRRVERLEKELS